MASKPQPPQSEHHHPNGRNGLGLWLLSALGLLWVGGLAYRTLRGATASSPHTPEPSAAPSEGPRFTLGLSPVTQSRVQPTHGYEKSDANAKRIATLVIGLLVSGIALQAILAVCFTALRRMPYPVDRWQPIQQRPSAAQARSSFPKLQISPPADLQAFRAQEAAALNSYGWINRTAGVVRIPIEKAMDLVLQEGLPSRSDTNTARAGPSTYQLMLHRAEHHEREVFP